MYVKRDICWHLEALKQGAHRTAACALFQADWRFLSLQDVSTEPIIRTRRAAARMEQEVEEEQALHWGVRRKVVIK